MLSHKRNTIWEIKISNGSTAEFSKEITEENKFYFKNLFRGPKTTIIGEIIFIISSFPKLINE